MMTSPVFSIVKAPVRMFLLPNGLISVVKRLDSIFSIILVDFCSNLDCSCLFAGAAGMLEYTSFGCSLSFSSPLVLFAFLALYYLLCTSGMGGRVCTEVTPLFLFRK